ncbi:single-stranded DNA-binding family protein [[Clostridium] bifermentans ATCC 638]|uniref:Single-stranded DNA-binding protein n=1 Tax=Paraclostridium bifermentans ATCC 638 = DSM 14991 TaxID=1233171 RepID=T4VF98_PARBF|nr:single-stranded DNA-binding protein [Paraclostridium bifermentans]EQK39790.1 single-stranded DNA-binding family protein [[Clostridium] bifermentans ATCC 638] [Paraclostridium bifermentans ATCC 638 = DSM 14991]
MNKLILTGRLTKDAELSFIPGSGTPKMTYTLAVERSYQKDKNNKKVDFIPCEAIGKHCENLCQYVTKGKLVAVTGELNIDQYESNGEKKSFTKCKVDSLEFLGGSNDNKQDNQNQGFQPIDDDDIPF